MRSVFHGCNHFRWTQPISVNPAEILAFTVCCSLSSDQCYVQVLCCSNKMLSMTIFSMNYSAAQMVTSDGFSENLCTEAGPTANVCCDLIMGLHNSESMSQMHQRITFGYTWKPFPSNLLEDHTFTLTNE